MKVINFKSALPNVLIIQPIGQITGRNVSIKLVSGVFSVSVGCQSNLTITKDIAEIMMSELKKEAAKTRIVKCIIGVRNQIPSITDIFNGYFRELLEETPNVLICKGLNAFAKKDNKIVEVECPGMGQYFSFISTTVRKKGIVTPIERLMFQKHELNSGDDKRIIAILKVMLDFYNGKGRKDVSSVEE